MLVPILIALAVIIIVLVVVIATRPPDFRITRSATMTAPAPVIFAHVNDLHKWNAWSPWEKLDPALKRTFAGAPAGTGAIYEWDGNKKAGAGRMTITESHASDLITIKLEFLKPFQATNSVEFTFKPEGGKTTVTWTMTGKNDGFMLKAFSLFVNMDKMCGGDFENGLAQLESLVETPAGI